MTARLEEWEQAVVRGMHGEPVTIVSCPVCGCVLLHADAMAMARHALWHHERGEWPWAEM